MCVCEREGGREGERRESNCCVIPIQVLSENPDGLSVHLEVREGEGKRENCRTV